VQQPDVPAQERPRTRRQAAMTEHKVVDPAQWQAARDELLVREKQHTRMADELARQRRELPCPTRQAPGLQAADGLAPLLGLGGA
jgi:predicted dithiol-disulfide oxidoreductase (DUF899 family)